ncbi:MAG: hypothetical protein ACKVVT_13210 [Dehalococcoidia bacterium]
MAQAPTTQPTPASSPSPRLKFPAVAVIGFAALAFAGAAVLVASLASRDSSPVAAPAPAALPVGTVAAKPAPTGAIVFEVTGQGFFRAAAVGGDLVPADAPVSLDGTRSPDGRWLAGMAKQADGKVFLTLTGGDGVARQLVQIAGNDTTDPQLAPYGKGFARAVEGVPFVAAWSPDSRSLAFGSVMGEPYTLGVIRDVTAAEPIVTYAAVTGGYVGELAWSPDGTKVAISTYEIDRSDHTVLVYEVGQPSFTDSGLVAAKRLVDGCHIVWSPDSRYVAVHREPREEPGAWAVSVTDPADRWAISHDPAAFPWAWVA